MGLVLRYLIELKLFFGHLGKLWYFYKEFGNGFQLSNRDHGMIGAVSRFPWKILERGDQKHQRVLYDSGTFNVGFHHPKVGTEIIYVNGICTTLHTAKMEASLIAKELKRPVTLAYNETHGFWEDLYDCARMRVRNKSDSESQSLVEWIEASYLSGIRTFMLIGYSQGSIIVCHALDRLPEEIREKCTFEVLTFGAAQDELKSYPNGHAVHVGHTGDFVASTGAIHYWNRHKIYGRLVTTEETDHNIFEYITTMRAKDVLSDFASRL